MSRGRLGIIKGWAIAMALAVVVVPAVAAPPAAAADLSQFDPGNIISDEVFFDRSTMTEGEIQAFFQSRVSSCRSGHVCLINFRADTTTREATPRCARYEGAPAESAARIVYKVAQACNINPRVLIVMLQKEQGLVTKSAPGTWEWLASMGYGCPDTAPCETQYYGFYNQVYLAAAQMQRYTQSPNSWNYRPGRTNTVRFHPNSACGSTSVYIHNQATANLYIYTPYQPNAAALAAGYGTGDSCSSYGNRNFYNYFTDWFGPTTYNTPGEIGTYWRSIGAAASEVGSPWSYAFYDGANGGGNAQEFTKGYIYVSPSGTAGLRKNSGIFAVYSAAGSQRGTFGWPRSSERCSSNGCVTSFQYGAIGWTPSAGIQQVVGDAFAVYGRQGYSAGPLGVPLDGGLVASSASAEGVVQQFTGGAVYLSDAGDHYLRLSSGITSRYFAEGGLESDFGWPRSSETCVGTACWVQFEGGTIAWTAATGVQTVVGDAAVAYNRNNGPTGALGVPIGPAYRYGVNGGGFAQDFQRGYIYTSDFGAVGLRKNSGIFQRYSQLGSQYGPLGWPTRDESCPTNRACVVSFQNGDIAWTPTGGVRVLPLAIATAYREIGGLTGTFGAPLSDEWRFAVNGGGSAQEFTTGYIYSSTFGAYPLRKNSGLFQRYAQLGSQYGVLGWPTGPETCVGTSACSIPFQSGVLGWTPSTGVRTVLGAMAVAYRDAGGPASTLGVPTSSEFFDGANGGGRAQAFQGGYGYSSVSGAAMLDRSSPIYDAYAALSSQRGSLGWPVANAVCTTDTCTMTFQFGRLIEDRATSQVTRASR